MDAISTVLSNSFGQFHKMLGSSCLAYKECEVRKQQIIHAKEFQHMSDLETDSLLCVLYTKAQKHIETEILFLYIIITQLHFLTNGKIRLLNTRTKQKSKKLKKGLKKRGGTRNTINQPMQSKTTTIISLFLLISLKSLTAQSMEMMPISTTAALKLQKAELDPLNYTQMEEFAEKFGLLNKGAVKQYKSTNLTADFANVRNDMFKYFSEMMSVSFHDEVIAKTDSLFNDNIFPVHRSLIRICEMTMKESTDKSPAEIGEIFSKIVEETKEEFLLEKERIIEKTQNEIDEEITLETGIPKESLFTSIIRTFSYGQEISSSMELDVRSRLGWERLHERLPSILENHEVGYINSIKDTLKKETNKFQNLKNRKIFLENICKVSIQPPQLNYNKTESIIYFTDFPEQRSLIEAMIANVLLYAGKHDKTLSEEEERKNHKQIEMATFLSDIFMKWDKTFANAIMYGHKGKKDVTSFFKEVIREINILHEEMNVGLRGNPSNVKKAIENIREASNEAEIKSMNIDARQIIQDQVREERKQTIDTYQQFYDYIIDFSTKPIQSGYFKGKAAVTELVISLLCLLGLLGFGAMQAANAVLYVRTSSPFFIQSKPQQGQILNHKKPQPLAIGDVGKEEFVKRRSGNLLVRRDGTKCKNGSSFVKRLGGCVEKKHNSDNFANWYLSRKENDVYDANKIYDPVSDDEKRSPYLSHPKGLITLPPPQKKVVIAQPATTQPATTQPKNKLFKNRTVKRRKSF